MGNEVWDQMTGKEFAEWCQMTVEVIKQVHPNAKVGADPSSSRMAFARPFFEAGGMKGMDIIYTHPYCFTPLPEWRVRPWMRNLRDMVADANGGKPLDIYVTEYGWPTAAKDTRKNSVSETIQAQRTVRQSIMMYAEDVKTLIPHWMADREQDITDRENWFGFFRLSGQPKPVVIAHANCARMIDGSQFVGDLWNGPGLASMLFEKDGKFTLALWTAEEPKQATVDAGVDEVTLVDIMGRESAVKTPGGKLTRTFDANVVYLVGVSPSLAAHVTPPSADLNSDLWNKRDNPFVAHRAAGVVIDGKLDEWPGDWINLTGDDKLGHAQASVRWDEKNLYVAMKVSDKNLAKPGTFKIALGTKPGRQQTSPSYYDCILALTPDDDARDAKLTILDPGRTDKPVAQSNGSAPNALHWAIQPADGGFTAEISAPIALFRGMPPMQAGSRMTCRLSYEKSRESLANCDSPPRMWSYLTLAR
jgi:hypothetical protein